MYYSKIMHRRRVRYSALGTGNIVVARRREAEFRTRLVNEDPTLNVCPTLSQFEKKFTDYQAPRVEGSTAMSYQNSWAVLRDFRDVPLNEISASYIEDFIQAQLAAGKAVATVNLYLSGLQRGLNIAKDLGVVQSVPKIRHLPGENRREYVISPEVEARLVAAAAPELADAMVFAIETGLRRHEICDLTKDDWKDGKIYVRKGKTKTSTRAVPLSRKALVTLEVLKSAWRPEVPYIFTLQDGMNAMYPDFLSHTFRDARAAAGVTDSDCVFHSTRHTFCTRLGKAGASAFEIMKLAGHASITMSARYAHPDDEQLSRAIERMNR